MFKSRSDHSQVSPEEQLRQIDAKIQAAESKRTELEGEYEKCFGEEAIAEAAICGDSVSMPKRSAMQDEITFLDATIEALISRKQAVRGEVARTKIAAAYIESDKLQEKSAAMMRLSDGLQHQRDALEREIRSVHSQISQYRRHISQLEASL